MSFVSHLPHYAFTLLVYLTMLMVLVAAHELGHYLFARLFGMGAEEFAVGMFGKKPLLVLGKRRYTLPVGPNEDANHRGEANPMEGGSPLEPSVVVETPQGLLLRETTVFTVRPWPLGGFVRIKGMIPEADGAETRIPGGFFSKAPWKRWVVLAAGPAFSVLAGILLLIPYLTIYGEPRPTTTVAAVLKSKPAYKAGIRAGDVITKIDGQPVQNWYGMITKIRDHGTRPVTVEVQRGTARITTTFAGEVDKEPSPVLGPDSEPTGENRIQTRLGVGMDFTNVPVPLSRALSTAVRIPINAALGLADRFLHPSTLVESVGGPGTMIKATSDSINEGFWPVVSLAALLSISVGIFNLLPIPPLDGGQMWIAVVEMFRRGRRLSLETQMRVLNLGFALVAVLIVGILMIDVSRFTGLTKSDDLVTAPNASPNGKR